MKRVLIVNPYGIGDVIFSSPIIDNLKIYNPDVKIYYVANKRTVPLLEYDGRIEDVIVYEKSRFDKIREESFPRWVKEYACFVNKLRKLKVDTVFDLSMSLKIGRILFFAGIPKRVGFNYKNRGFFMTDKVDINGFTEKHVTLYYLDLLKKVGIDTPVKEYSLFINKDDILWAEKIAGNFGDGMKVAIAPFGGESFGPNAYVKRWNIEKYSEFVNRIILKYGVSVFVLAAPYESAEVENFMSMVNRKDRVFYRNDFTVSKVAALASVSDFVIGNDTGLVRFGNTFRKRTILFFGPADEVVYGLFPYDEKIFRNAKIDLECRPCYKHPRLEKLECGHECLKNLSVDYVMSLFEELV